MTQVPPSEIPPVIDYEDSDYQSTFWDEGDREYEDQVEAIALKNLLPETGDLLLETGAGAGRNTPRYHGFKQVVLLDYSLTQLQQAKERLGETGRYIYVAANIYRLPFLNGLFDAATMIRTIHHMADAPLALHQIREVLRSDAIFILEYANKKNLKAIGRYALRRQSWSPFTLEPVEFVELNYDFHPEAIRNWLKEADFEVERQLTVSHFRLNLLKRLIPTKLLVRMDALIQPTGRWWQLTPSVFIRARVIGDSSPPPPGELFACPHCGSGSLDKHAEKLVCKSCLKHWGIIDGIYDFRDPLE